MTLRPAEWVVIAGSGLIVAFAVLVGVLIYQKPPPVPFVYMPSELSSRGEAVYRREGCSSCHEIFGNGASYGPSLDGVGSYRSAAWLAQYLKAPRAGVGKKKYRLRMPAYDKLDVAELDALVAYLGALKVSAERPRPVTDVSELATR